MAWVDERNAVMVMNGAPQTRSWYRAQLTARNPTMNENENGCMWRALHVQIYTPIMLTRYGGNHFGKITDGVPLTSFRVLC
jgi:hypothetical protein